MAKTELTETEILAQIPAARERGRVADEGEPRARSARYNPDTGRVEVELRDDCLFAFPAVLGQGLAHATPEQLAEVEVTPDGYGLHWESLDADLAVPSLLAGRFGSKRWMEALGRAGGRVKSPAKTRAARENGKKGGRPRKTRDAA